MTSEALPESPAQARLFFAASALPVVAALGPHSASALDAMPERSEQALRLNSRRLPNP
jgi:hypothetical protein